MNGPDRDRTGPASVRDFASFWTTLDNTAAAQNITKKQWVRRAGKLAGKRFAEKTLYDRITKGRRVSWEDAQWFVKAVDGADLGEWKAAWERAEACGDCVA
jgi:hypothetical protein